MLQFLRKSSRNGGGHGNDDNINDEKTPDASRSHQSQHKLQKSSSDSPSVNVLGTNLLDEENEENLESRSRLSMSLVEIISDKTCLSYFIQFLEMKKALALIKFYLDAESFKTAANIPSGSNKKFCKNQKLSKGFKHKNDNEHNSNNRISKNKSLTSSKSLPLDRIEYNDNSPMIDTEMETCDRMSIISQQSDINFPVNNLSIDQEPKHLQENLGREASESILEDEERNITCELKVDEINTLCDLTMHKSLTDDEKSEIFATECKNKKNANLKTNLTENTNSENCAKSESHIKVKKTENNYSKKSLANSTIIASDAIRIYRKYLVTNSQYFIDIPATILSEISLNLGQTNMDNSCTIYCDESDSGGEKERNNFCITSSCFEAARIYVFERLEKEYLNDFVESPFYCKYCVDILTSSNLTLSDILHSESAWFFFMEYLEQENQQNYLEFWLAGTNFKKHYGRLITTERKIPSDMKEARNDAMILYEKYFSLQASNSLNISNNIRSRIEELICCDDEKLIEAFDLPLKVIEKHLEKNHFSNFLSSQLFANYLNELRSKIKDHNITDCSNYINNNDMNSLSKKLSHRKTRSDCSVDSVRAIRNNFISQQNTLLAMENPSSRMKQSSAMRSNTIGSNMSTSAAISSHNNDMQIDSRLLTNPDLLWQRNGYSSGNNVNGGLSFGRVDALGRYERDFEPSTHPTEEKWSIASGSNKLKNVVRKLVHLPEDKMQEEIAWQVAEMIVKDVTSVTLGTNSDNSV